MAPSRSRSAGSTTGASKQTDKLDSKTKLRENGISLGNDDDNIELRMNGENILPEEEMTTLSGNENIATELTAMSSSNTNGLTPTDDNDASVAAVAMAAAAAAAAVGYPGGVVVPDAHTPPSSKPLANNKVLINRRSYSRSEYSHEGRVDEDYNEQAILKLCLTYDQHNNLRVKIPTRCVYCPVRTCRQNFNSSKQTQAHYDDAHSDELGLGPHYDVRAERRLMTADEKRKADSITRRRAKKSSLYTPAAHCLDLQREIRRRAFQVSKTVQVYSSMSPEGALNDIRSRWRFLCMRKQNLDMIEFLRTTVPFYIAVQLNSAIQSDEDTKKVEELLANRANDELPLLWNDLHWTGNRVTGFRNACYAYHYLSTGEQFRSYNYYELPANDFEPSYNVTIPRILLRDIPLYSARYADEYRSKPDVVLDAEGQRSLEEFKLNLTNMVNLNSHFKENMKILSDNNWSILPSIENIPHSAKTINGLETVREFLIKCDLPSEPKFLDKIINGSKQPISYEEGVEPFSVAVANAIAKASTKKHPPRLTNDDEPVDHDDEDDGTNFYTTQGLVGVDVSAAAAVAAAAAAAAAVATATAATTVDVNASPNSLDIELPEPIPVDPKDVDPSLQGAGEHEEVESKEQSLSNHQSVVNEEEGDADNVAFTSLLQAVEEENKRKRQEEYDHSKPSSILPAKRSRSSKPKPMTSL